MPSIFSLLPFIFQLPPTKNFLSIVKCWGKVQTVQLDKQTWNVWLKSSLLNWSAGHDLSTGSDCTPAVNSAGCGNCSGPSRALIRRAVKRAGPSKKVWCSRLGSRGDFWQPLITPEARKERSCQSFSASHIGPLPKSGLPVSPPGLFPPWDPVCGTRQQTRQRHLWTKQLLPSKIVVHFHAVGLGVIHAHIPMLRLRSTLLGDISLSTPNTPVQVTTWYTSSNVVPATKFTSERQYDAWEIDSESTYVQHDKATPIFL